MDILFLPFSLEPGLSESRPDLPLGALVRQVPHLLCSLAHGQDGLRARFFPFVSSESGKRGFTSFEDLLPPEQVLGQLLQSISPTPTIVIDGHVGAVETCIRALRHTAEGPEITGLASFPTTFEDPRVLLNRLTLELWDLLDLATRVRTPPRFGREALWLFLEGKDRELALRAGLVTSDEDPFAPIVQALALEPQSQDLHDALLAMASVSITQGRGDPLLAAAALAHAAENDEVRMAWLSQAFRLAQQSGHNEATLELGRAILLREPGQEELALSLARHLAGRRRYSEARRLLRDCIEAPGMSADTESSTDPEMANPNRDEQRGHVFALLFQLSSTLGDDDACDRWMEALLQCKHRPVAVLPFAAQWLMDQRRWDSAQAILSDATDQEQVAPELALAQGRLLLLRGQQDQAKPWLEIAIAGDPHVETEAQRLTEIADGQPVLADLKEIETLNHAGSLPEALDLARKVVKIRPDLAESWYALGLVRSTLGQARRAIRALRQALSRRHDYPAARNRLGILLVSTGRYQDGYRELQQVLEADQDMMSPLLHMTQACYHLKRHEEGVQYLKRAEELFPDHPAVRQTRTTFYPGSWTTLPRT
jgi:tetratricopeptide (TPR) repeat protein